MVFYDGLYIQLGLCLYLVFKYHNKTHVKNKESNGKSFIVVISYMQKIQISVTNVNNTDIHIKFSKDRNSL